MKATFFPSGDQPDGKSTPPPLEIGFGRWRAGPIRIQGAEAGRACGILPWWVTDD